MNDDIKTIINNLLVQVTVNSVKINLISSLVLEVCSELLPEDKASKVYTNFTDKLLSELEEIIGSIDKILLDNDDLAFALRQKMQHMAIVQNIKNHYLYKRTN